MDTEDQKNPQEMLKKAGVMLKNEHLRRKELEKTAHAQKLAFKKVELGILEPFGSYEDFQKEAEAIIEEGDLPLQEKALDYGTIGGQRSGELEKQASLEGQPNPIEHLVMTGNLLE